MAMQSLLLSCTTAHHHQALPTSASIFSIDGKDFVRPQKVNQDAHFQSSFEIDGIRFAAFGVMDGHGLKGHILTEYLAKQLPQRLEEQLKMPVRQVQLEDQLTQLGGMDSSELSGGHRREEHQALINAFHQAHWDAMQNPDVNAGRNGATCIVGLFQENDDSTCDLHIAHVGDSRAIQIKKDGSSIHTLAQETIVKLDDERERIDAREGTIRGTNVFYGPVGIAMTRSLGNAVMLRAGVVPTPFVGTVRWDHGDALCMATDGVWDVLNNGDVQNLIMQQTNTTSVSKMISEKALEKWIGNLPIQDEIKSDDITCIVVG